MPAKKTVRLRFDLAVFGEFFSDMIFYNLHTQPRLGEEVKTDSFVIAPGGALATSAIAASRLGSETAILTRIGADAHLLPTWNQMLKEGLDTSACMVMKDQPTALTVSVAYRGNRMLITHEPINHEIEKMFTQRRVIATLSNARHVHFACALRRPRRWTPVMKMLREKGITVSANFGWNPAVSATQVREIVNGAQFIFPNEHEAKALTGASTTKKALERLCEWVRVPVIKLDSRGAMLMAEGKLYRQPAFTSSTLDATGAGDAFDGGFLHSFLHGADWDTCLRAGNVCSGLSASQPGGSLGLPGAREFRKHMSGRRVR
jgi:sugar/nucleoside kinase (ribokinase family)